MAKKRTSVIDKPTPTPNVSIVEKPPFLTTTLGKIVAGVVIFSVVFTIGYGIWRLSGGSFKAKTTCPDAAIETSLRDKATANPNDFAAHYDYADYVYSKCKNFDLAIKTYQKTIILGNQPGSTVSTADKTKAYLGLGLSYFYGPRDIKAAQAEFKAAAGLQPENTLALYMLATSFKSDDPAQALALFKKVTQLAPDSELGKSAQSQVIELSK